MPLGRRSCDVGEAELWRWEGGAELLRWETEVLVANLCFVFFVFLLYEGSAMRTGPLGFS